MTCLKIQFTKREADAAVRKLSAVGKQYRKEKRAYHCPNCNMWHITSQEDGMKIVEAEDLTYRNRWEELLKESA